MNFPDPEKMHGYGDRFPGSDAPSIVPEQNEKPSPANADPQGAEGAKADCNKLREAAMSREIEISARIAALDAELATLRTSTTEEGSLPWWQAKHDKLGMALIRAEAQLSNVRLALNIPVGGDLVEAARRAADDSRRLDWLENGNAGCNFGARDKPDQFHVWIYAPAAYDPSNHFYGSTMRAAIDAARQPEAKPL